MLLCGVLQEEDQVQVQAPMVAEVLMLVLQL
jgi:hypothetical protein